MMIRNYLILCFMLLSLALKAQTVNIFIHNFSNFPDATAINTTYTNVGFTTVNITSGSIDSTLTVSNYQVAYIVEYYNYSTASTVFLTSAQRQVVEDFINNGGHVVWIAESIDSYIGNPTPPPVNANAITTINTLYGTNLSYGPFFNNGGMGPPDMPRIHPSAGPGGLSQQPTVLSSGSYATLLNVPAESKVYTSDGFDNINFFDTCTHTTLALFPAYPTAGAGSVIISSELGLPFYGVSVGPFGGPPIVFNTILDSTIATLHFKLLTNASMTSINNWSTITSNTNPNCSPLLFVIMLDSIEHVFCNGDSSGGVFVTPTGGTAPYAYAWSNGATSQNITGVPGGSYTVTVTDANGLTRVSGPHVVYESLAVVVALDKIDSVSCNGVGDGAVQISVTGGVAPYSYAWTNGATTQDITGLSGGVYTVTVTDVYGCTSTSGPHVVHEASVLAISLDKIDSVSCHGAGDGAVDVSVTGGTIAYHYNWSNGATTEDITGLSGGTYSLTVTDANGCTTTTGPHVVNDAPALVVSLDNIDSVSCNGAGDGAVEISVTGGVPTYTYNWNNGAGSNQDLNNIRGNSYTVTITDANGCTVTSGPHVVHEPDSLKLVIVGTVPLEGCLGEANGVLDASTIGGTSGYSYNWSNTITTATNTGLNTGVYSLTVTDANGCTVIGVDSIQDPFRPIVNPFVGQAPVKDTSIHKGILIVVDAGNDQSANGVTYNWTELSSLGTINFGNAAAASTTVQPEPTTSGTYTLLVTATSTDGCIDTGTIRIRILMANLLGIPTAFTPNGDNMNDYFRPTNLDKQFILEFKIYNRWGQLVHDGVNTDAQWNGQFKGVEQPAEVYIYMLRYQIPGQEEQTIKGEMTLMR